MAAHPENSAQALIARIDAARGVMGAEARDLRQRLDFKTRIRRSIFSKPLVWLGGSAGTGLLASFLLRRGKPKPQAVVVTKQEKERGIFGFLLGSAFSLLRPALEAWLMKQVRNRLTPAQPEPWRRD